MNICLLIIFSCIIHLDDKDCVDTHWVCFCTDKKFVEYFDNFGLLPAQEGLFNTRKKKEIIFKYKI